MDDKMRGNLSGADLETMVKTNDIESRTKVMADCRGTLSMAVAYRGLGLGLAVNPAKLAGKNQDYEFNLNSYSNRYGFDVVYLSSKTFHGSQEIGSNQIDVHKGEISQQAINLNFIMPSIIVNSPSRQLSAKVIYRSGVPAVG